MSAKILLADCVSAYRNVVANQLRGLGAEVVETEDGTETIEVMRKHSFDVAIIDNYLVERSSVDLLPVLAEDHAYTKVILIVEPSLDPSVFDEFKKKKGVTKILSGPVHPRVLMETVEAVILGLPDKTASQEPPKTDDAKEATVSSTEADEDLKQRLDSVRRAYQKKLPGEIVKLEKVLKNAKRQPEDMETIKEAHRLAHTLHGTSGTLGFAEISAITEELEELLKKIMSDGFVDDDLWETIFEALERARTAPERPSLLENVTSPIVHSVATILIADNDEQTALETAETAKKNLLTIVSANNYEEVLARAKTARLDGAIIDIDFDGEGNSFKIAKELRSIEGLENLPVAIMSEDSSIENRVAATHAGATQFLQKPLNIDEVVEAARYFTTVTSSVSSRVLIVDDDEMFGAHVEAILRSEGMEVAYLDEPERIFEVIDRFHPDLLLLDVMMPKVSGFEVCRMLRSINLWKELPILFLTAESSAEVRLECFRSGGDDYIEKPVIKEELLARIGVRLERIRFFKEKADRDGLTNLPNRRAFLDMFKLRIAEGQRYNRPVSLCIIDLDKFKLVNDTYGHLAGDKVLVGLGKLLSSRFRTVDIRGRWGGEEFAVVFYGEGLMTSKMILTRVLKEFRELEFEGDHGEKFNVSFSCGISSFPRDGKTFDELFRSADEKLYRVKETGRNRVEI